MNVQPCLFSVIVPVRNEESFIESSIAYLRKTSSLFPVEIVVVDGLSQDRTKEIAALNADIVVESPKASRAYQMHLGAERSTGSNLIFLHADSRLPKNWQEILTREFLNSAAETPALLSFRIAFDSGRLVYKMIALLANLRTHFTGIPHGDQAFILKRHLYFSAGGFPDVPLMEEYLFLRKLRRVGSVKILKEFIVTSARRYAARGPFRNSLTNSLFILLFYLGFSTQRIAKWYY